MTLDLVVDELEEILNGGHGVQESEYRSKRRSAADSLQGIACTESEAAETAWNILEDAVTEADLRVALQASLALAYTAASSEEDWGRAMQIYEKAVSSSDRETRLAAVDGLRKAFDVNSAVAGDAIDLFGDAARTGLNSIVEKHDDVESVQEISSDQARRERSCWKALAGLSEAVMHDMKTVEEVVDEDTISLFLEACFEDGVEKLF
ncbi:hypothetical protein [Halosimplex pelagicum]|uniref:HEAT repeat domain-containing protein n=1 Tax=Halosimplex pelagicum TaxID=869886 RepID=A0A7D5T737_9EURY|nr:hypothetical protein [Halosimplex pelagicum]QLH83828.1 hypothetical protein HZS54_20300 [Halosimplex pelagicum]